MPTWTAKKQTSGRLIQGALPTRADVGEIRQRLSTYGAKYLEILRIEPRMAGTKSIWPTTADGPGIATHRPGQHLPIRVTVDGEPKLLVSTYTPSLARSDEPIESVSDKRGVYQVSYKSFKPAIQSRNRFDDRGAVPSANFKGTSIPRADAEGMDSPSACVTHAICLPRIGSLNRHQSGKIRQRTTRVHRDVAC
jgi:hypothetical protein